jgi:hypothetical protein
MNEDGSMPGEGLTALETSLYFFGAPLGLFILISVIVWALTGPSKSIKVKNKSSLTQIE